MTQIQFFPNMFINKAKFINLSNILIQQRLKTDSGFKLNLNLAIHSVIRHSQYKMKYLGQITSEICFNW